MKFGFTLWLTAVTLLCMPPTHAFAEAPAKASSKTNLIDWTGVQKRSPVAVNKSKTNGWIVALKRNDCKGISIVTSGRCADKRCYSSCQTGTCRGIARGDHQSCSGDGVCKGVARVIHLLGECYDTYDRNEKKQGRKFDKVAARRKLKTCDARARSNAKTYCSGPYTRLCKGWVTGDSSYCKSGDRDCKGVVRKDKSYCESANCKAIARGDKSYCR
jgi:hypothetical protein